MISLYKYIRISRYKFIRTKGQQDSGISEVCQNVRIKEVPDIRISGYKKRDISGGDQITKKDTEYQLSF